MKMEERIYHATDYRGRLKFSTARGEITGCSTNGPTLTLYVEYENYHRIRAGSMITITNRDVLGEIFSRYNTMDSRELEDKLFGEDVDVMLQKIDGINNSVVGFRFH